MTKFVEYLRVSTREQGESGLGLEAQQGILDHYLDGQEVIDTFQDVQSGKDDHRPGLTAAINLCLETGAYLAVAKVDRLSRDTEDTLKILRQLDGRLFAGDVPTPPGQPIDKFTLTLIAAMADRERADQP